MSTLNLIDSFIHTGKLILANDLSSINFGIYNQQSITFSSLTDFLNGIYKSPTPYINLYIKKLDDNHICQAVGTLIKENDSQGILDWSIVHSNNYIIDNLHLGKQLSEYGELDLYVKLGHLTSLEDSGDAK